MAEAQTIEQGWDSVMEQVEILDRSVVEAEFAVRQATAALKGFRCLKSGSNIPTDIYYPHLVELMLELERVVAL